MPDSNSTEISQVSQPIIALLDRWQLSAEQMKAILSLPKQFRSRSFSQIRAGNKSLPDDDAVLRRSLSLLQIDAALETAFPFNSNYSSVWIRTPHRRFSRQTPLDLMMAEGEKGIVRVLCDVDCSISWDLSGSSLTS